MNESQAAMTPLISFGADASPTHWYTVNDDVMGGRSDSRMTEMENHGVFSGTLSLENNGGFASVRSLISIPSQKGSRGVRIRVRGDGREYRLRFRTNRQMDGAAYQMVFRTEKDRWCEVELPYEEFLPTFRGRVLEGYPPLEPDTIQQVAFMIADRREGPFRLDIEWIRTYGDQPWM